MSDKRLKNVLERLLQTQIIDVQYGQNELNFTWDIRKYFIKDELWRYLVIISIAAIGGVLAFMSEDTEVATVLLISAIILGALTLHNLGRNSLTENFKISRETISFQTIYNRYTTSSLFISEIDRFSIQVIELRDYKGNLRHLYRFTILASLKSENEVKIFEGQSRLSDTEKRAKALESNLNEYFIRLKRAQNT
ncbi:MAG: hypothetical protein AAGC47_07750 [Bacteroidota bacterium]